MFNFCSFLPVSNLLERLVYLVCSVWVARRLHGYAFVDCNDKRDAQDAIHELDGTVIITFSIHILLNLKFPSINLG